MIKWAKERGIITAEFQHGAVSKIHPAYNYGEAILNSEEYKKVHSRLLFNLWRILE